MSVGWALTGCAGSTGSGKTQPPTLGPIPAKLKQRCDDPVKLPPGAKTKKQVEALWGKDRKSLVLCRDSKSGLVKFIEDRDRRIGGDK